MLDLPIDVYKYRTWDNASHRNLLLYNELYLASPKDFNDPFDVRVPPNFSLLSRSERDQYITDILIQQYPELISQNIDLKKKISELEIKFSDIDTFQKEYEKIYFENLDRYYGIIAMSCRWNSILMWSHYANSHKGFCVGFNELKLRNSFHPLPVAVGKVQYKSNFPEIKPKVSKNIDDPKIMANLFEKTHIKSIYWRYEREYRIMSNFYPKCPLPFERIIHFKNDVFTEVILGIQMPNIEKEEIKFICKMKNIPVFQAKKSNLKFQIEKEILN